MDILEQVNKQLPNELRLEVARALLNNALFEHQEAFSKYRDLKHKVATPPDTVESIILAHKDKSKLRDYRRRQKQMLRAELDVASRVLLSKANRVDHMTDIFLGFLMGTDNVPCTSSFVHLHQENVEDTANWELRGCLSCCGCREVLNKLYTLWEDKMVEYGIDLQDEQAQPGGGNPLVIKELDAMREFAHDQHWFYWEMYGKLLKYLENKHKQVQI